MVFAVCLHIYWNVYIKPGKYLSVIEHATGSFINNRGALVPLYPYNIIVSRRYYSLNWIKVLWYKYHKNEPRVYIGGTLYTIRGADRSKRSVCQCWLSYTGMCPIRCCHVQDMLSVCPSVMCRIGVPVCSPVYMYVRFVCPWSGLYSQYHIRKVHFLLNSLVCLVIISMLWCWIVSVCYVLVVHFFMCPKWFMCRRVREKIYKSIFFKHVSELCEEVSYTPSPLYYAFSQMLLNN